MTFAWTHTSGPTVFLTNGTTASPSFITPGVPPGGADLSFSVTVTNGFGVTDTASTTVHVVDATDPKSFPYIKSQAGDPVGNGQTETFNEWGGKFTAFAGFNNNVSVSFVSEDGLERWGVLLGPPWDRLVACNLGNTEMQSVRIKRP